MLGPGRTYGKLTLAIWTMTRQRLGATPAECAFKRANPGVVAAGRKIASATLAIGPHIKHGINPLEAFDVAACKMASPHMGNDEFVESLAAPEPRCVGEAAPAGTVPGSRAPPLMLEAFATGALEHGRGS